MQVGEPVDGDPMPGLQDMDDLSSGGDRSDRQCYLGAETLVANLPNKFRVILHVYVHSTSV